MTTSGTGDHAIRCAIKSCLYMVIVTMGDSRRYTSGVMMLNVSGDRKVLPDDHQWDR